MLFTATDLQDLNRLLDEADAVAAGPVREAWLQALPASVAHLVPDLRVMLGEQDAPATVPRP